MGAAKPLKKRGTRGRISYLTLAVKVYLYLFRTTTILDFNVFDLRHGDHWYSAQ
jgi:hypothetical protein